jgi:hypothetical protein
VSDAFKQLQERKRAQVEEYERVMTKGINDYAHAAELKEKLKTCLAGLTGGHYVADELLESLWDAVRECIPPDFIEEYERIRAERAAEKKETWGERVN